jgi:hypothetical protein
MRVLLAIAATLGIVTSVDAQPGSPCLSGSTICVWSDFDIVPFQPARKGQCAWPYSRALRSPCNCPDGVSVELPFVWQKYKFGTVQCAPRRLFPRK